MQVPKNLILKMDSYQYLIYNISLLEFGCIYFDKNTNREFNN